MVEINWGLIGAAPDVGAAVLQGYQVGQQLARQRATENALRAYATNPDDPRAVGALIQADPRIGLQIRQQQAERQQALAQQQRQLTEDHWKVIGQVAQWADTPEKWDAGVDHLVEQGIPEAAQYKGKFDPALRTTFMAKAGIEPNKTSGTAMQQNYEWLKTQDPVLANQYLHNQAEGSPIVVDNGDGTRTIYPRSQLTGHAGTTDVPSAAPPAEGADPLRSQAEAAIAKGADPAKVWARYNEMRKGGASPSGSATFPGPH
jgi:hypothetical protein